MISDKTRLAISATSMILLLVILIFFAYIAFYRRCDEDYHPLYLLEQAGYTCEPPISGGVYKSNIYYIGGDYDNETETEGT